jgi:hypothetical protein
MQRDTTKFIGTWLQLYIVNASKLRVAYIENYASRRRQNRYIPYYNIKIIYPTTKLPGILFHTSYAELLANVRLLSRSNSLCSIGCYCHALNIDPHNVDHKKNTASCVRREFDRRTEDTERRLKTCVLNNTHMWFRLILFHRTLQPYPSCSEGSEVESRPRDLLS